MLVLSRRVGEKIIIGDNISIVVNRVSGNRVSIGVEAPEDVKIVRGELDAISRSFEPEPESAEPMLPQESDNEVAHGTFLSAS